jgi:hypothetical protein
MSLSYTDSATVTECAGYVNSVTPSLELLELYGLDPLGHKVAQVILVEQGHTGLTVNSIILKDMYHLMQPLIPEHLQSTCVFPFDH